MSPERLADSEVSNCEPPVMDGNEQQLSRKTILLVEPDSDIGEMIKDVIQSLTSCQVVRVRDGNEAMSLMRNSIPIGLITAHRLPTMSGFDLVDFIHNNPKWQDLPVILLTLSPEQCLIPAHQRHLTMLAEPFELNELLRVVDAMMS